jgi:hypothetical protein
MSILAPEKQNEQIKQNGINPPSKPWKERVIKCGVIPAKAGIQ